MEVHEFLVKLLVDRLTAMALKCRRLRGLADGYRAKLPTADERAVLDAAHRYAAAQTALSTVMCDEDPAARQERWNDALMERWAARSALDVAAMKLGGHAMTPAERAALDARDLDSRIADAAREWAAACEARDEAFMRDESSMTEEHREERLQTSARAARAALQLKKLCAEKPTRRRVVVWQRWEVRVAQQAPFGGYTMPNMPKKKIARDFARSVRKQPNTVSATIIRVTRYRMEKA
jgi:hypothetical protein